MTNFFDRPGLGSLVLSALILCIAIVAGESFVAKERGPALVRKVSEAKAPSLVGSSIGRPHAHPQPRSVVSPSNAMTSNIVAWWAGPSSLTNAPPLDDTATITYGALPTYPDFSGILINGGAESSVEFPGTYVVALTFDAEYGVYRESMVIDPVEGQSVFLTDEDTHRLLLSNDGRDFTPVPIVEEDTLSSSVSSSSTTYATAMTVSLEAGTQHCHAHGIVTDSVPADGALIRLNTSGLTASSNSQSSGQLTSSTPALLDVEPTIGSGSIVLTGTALGTGIFDFDATLVVTSSGDLTVDVAQATHTTGIASLPAGASLRCSM